MGFLAEVWAWFTTASNWSGGSGIVNRLWEHVQLSGISVAVAATIALPPAVALGHTGRGGNVAIAAVNIGRAVPSFAIMVLALPITVRLGLGFGFWPSFLALVALALPPMFTNAYTGVRQVDAALVEAARGMGMTGPQVLTMIELPAAAPIILAAVRVSAVQVVATATLAAIVAWGGLGRFIIDGFAAQDNAQVFAGGTLVALLAVATEAGFSWLERLVVPKPLRAGPQDVRRIAA